MLIFAGCWPLFEMRLPWLLAQGCSTLLDDQEFEERPEAAESSAVAILAEGVGFVGLQYVVGEAAQAGEHAGF